MRVLGWLSHAVKAVCLPAALLVSAGADAQEGAPAALTAATAGLVDNALFTPPADALPAAEAFSGTIRLGEVEMQTEPADFTSRDILGKDPKIFPAVALSFITVGDDLVPAEQDVIRHGSLPEGESFWDVIVQPGKVWSVAGEDGWSRASFPFALVHSVEGETHNGVGMFAYKGDQVTPLRFQITQQTSPYYVVDYFAAWGAVPAELSLETAPDAAEIAARHERAMAAATPLLPWSELESRVGADALAGFDSDLAPSELVADGIGFEGAFYLRSCPSAAGELAYCDRQRFGVWSVTKAASNALALLRLAEKYGPEVFDERLAAHVPEAAGREGWDAVTFGDLLDMTTGLGNGTDQREPNNISDGYLDDTYPAWYEAPSEQAKIEAVFRDSQVYPWGPGEVARYRDEDMFLLGVAMTRYLRAREGGEADIWTLLSDEVYAPVGILVAPTNRTIEAEGPGQPMMAYGYYPTIGDLAKLAQLVANGGAWEGEQILNAEKLADILPGPEARGLPTGDPDMPFYRKAFWQAEYAGEDGCRAFYPVMSGWGGNLVPVFSKDVFAVRLAKNWDGGEAAGRLGSLASVADRLAPICGP